MPFVGLLTAIIIINNIDVMTFFPAVSTFTVKAESIDLLDVEKLWWSAHVQAFSNQLVNLQSGGATNQ